MTKADIVDEIYFRSGLTRKECVETVDLFFELIKSTLEKGETVKVTGFGNFVVHNKAARRGRNPKTGEIMEITARKVMKFKPGEPLKGLINNKIE